MDKGYDEFLGLDSGWLVGWGRISRHTGCSISTCKRLKGHGMPVRLLPTGSVVAIKGELNLWLIYYNEALEEEKKKEG